MFYFAILFSLTKPTWKNPKHSDSNLVCLVYCVQFSWHFEQFKSGSTSVLCVLSNLESQLVFESNLRLNQNPLRERPLLVYYTIDDIRACKEKKQLFFHICFRCIKIAICKKNKNLKRKSLASKNKNKQTNQLSGLHGSNKHSTNQLRTHVFGFVGGNSFGRMHN